MINAIDPNWAEDTHAVFPHSGRSRPKKLVFSYFFHKRTLEYTGPIHHIEGHDMPLQMLNKLLCFDEYECLGKTFNLDNL